MRGGHQEKNIFLDPAQGSKKVVFVHTEGALDKAAGDIASDKMTTDTADIKVESWKDYFKPSKMLNSVKKKGKQIWKYNLAREYYEEKEKLAAKKKIEESGSLYYKNDQDNLSAHDKAMGAIVSRFVEGADSEIEDELIHKQAGESVVKLDISSDVNRGIKNTLKELILKYAKGEIKNKSAFDEARRTKFEELSKTFSNIPKEIFGHGVEYSDNLFKVAEMARDAVTHGVALDKLDLEFDVILGKAEAGARTEVKQNFVEKGLDRIKKSKFGPLVNETTILAATALVTSVKKISQSLARSRALAWGTLGASAAVGSGLAGVTENSRLKKERAQIARERFSGKTSGGERRNGFEESNYEQVSATELVKKLNDAEQKFDKLSTEDTYEALVKILSEVNARINISDREKIDLITSYSEKTGETESDRLELDRLRARLRVKLKRIAVPPNLGIVSFQEKAFKEYLENSVSEAEASLTKTELAEKNRLFNQMKRKEVGKKMAITFASGVVFGSAFHQGIAWGKDAFGFGQGRPETALEHGWHSIKNLFKKDTPSGINMAGLGASVDSVIGSKGEYAIEAKIPKNTHVVWHGEKFDLLENGSNKHLVDNLSLNPDNTWTQESIKALKASNFEYALETNTSSKLVSAEDYWKDKLGVHERVDWHDEPGQRNSEFFRRLIEFEGKQQMLYLRQDERGVYMDVEAVYDNLVKNADYALKTFGTNPDGSTDNKLGHLVDELKQWKKDGTLAEHLQAAVIPTEEANKQGLSILIEGSSADPGKIYLGEEISRMMSDPESLRDGKLPVRFLELRLDGHVLATAQGKSLENWVVPAGNMPVITPGTSTVSMPHEWRLPDFVPVTGRRPLEKVSHNSGESLEYKKEVRKNAKPKRNPLFNEDDLEIHSPEKEVTGDKSEVVVSETPRPEETNETNESQKEKTGDRGEKEIGLDQNKKNLKQKYPGIKFENFDRLATEKDLSEQEKERLVENLEKILRDLTARNLLDRNDVITVGERSGGERGRTYIGFNDISRQDLNVDKVANKVRKSLEEKIGEVETGILNSEKFRVRIDEFDWLAVGEKDRLRALQNLRKILFILGGERQGKKPRLEVKEFSLVDIKDAVGLESVTFKTSSGEVILSLRALLDKKFDAQNYVEFIRGLKADEPSSEKNDAGAEGYIDREIRSMQEKFEKVFPERKDMFDVRVSKELMKLRNFKKYLPQMKDKLLKLALVPEGRNLKVIENPVIRFSLGKEDNSQLLMTIEGP